MPRVQQIQILRGVIANTPALNDGEFYYATDTNQVFIGSQSGNKTVGSGGSVQAFQAEIDFGSQPVAEAVFTISNPAVTSSSNISGNVAYVAPTGKDLDELEMDELDLKFGPGNGQFLLYARGRDGYVSDKFKISYLIG